MRRWLKRMTWWIWVMWASGRRSPHDGERGSQTLEWVGLGLVVMAIMGAALKAVNGGLGASIGEALAGFLRQRIPQ
jgi:hypothetical protein